MFKVFFQVSFIVVGGQQVSISHLAPSIISCPCAGFGRDIRIQVEFSNHCYTCGFDSAVHTTADVLLRDPERRVFDAVRHDLSLGLPAMMAALPGSKVHQSAAKRNYIYSTLITLPPAVGQATYQVFFTLRRATAGAGHDLRLFVESAYPLDGPPQIAKRPHAIRFAILALKVAKGQAVTFAAR